MMESRYLFIISLVYIIFTYFLNYIKRLSFSKKQFKPTLKNLF